MSDWQRKLLAYLHDPPEKAYDYGPKHKDRADAYLNRVLGPGQWANHQPDWTAAAADRFIFPDGKQLNAAGLPGLSGGVRFVHPLSGQLAFCENDFPPAAEAGDIISAVLPNFGEGDAELQFWLLWRCWLQYAVEHESGQCTGADKLAYLPADTRVPDGTIWHHNAIVSALEAARDAQGAFAPSFLLFQVGPVQDFIAQARSTRDLWSGSYLLSWMMAHAMQIIADRFGPDCIVFPSLRGQPLHDWLNCAKLKAARYAEDGKSFWDTLGLEKSQDLVLTPSLPNRFLAIVPADFSPQKLARVFDYGDPERPADERSEWRRICDACWEYLNSRAQLCPPNQENVKLRLWRFQCRHFWQVAWQLWPWPDVSKALELFKTIPLGKESALHVAKKIAEAIPAAHKDDRNYRNGQLNPGWAWSANYQLLSHCLDARRQTRDFSAWQGEPGTPKDHLSGKEEVIADRDEWLPRARENSELKHRFRKNDELGAINLIKRVWDKAYLEQLSRWHNGVPDLKRVRTSFDSVPAVAAAPFANWLRQQTAAGPLREPFLAFMEAASAAREHYPDSIASREKNENDWFCGTDASVFYLSEWDDALANASEDIARQLLTQAREALAGLLKAAGVQPSKYYAVLALDGDQIGRWLSGEMTPAVEQVLTKQAADYFRQHVKTADAEKWLQSPRPLSPSYHLQFSEALANFGLYAARRIVEAHHGQLIYSGGDDVLAMLPAGEAIACAQGLRLAFRGSPELPTRYPGLFAEAPEGFVRLADKNEHNDGDWNRGCRRPAEPSWPLLVPGPRADISAGIAIGHMHSPLQNLVEAARKAEKRAKDEYRDKKQAIGAFAVSLFKRSGEIIQWGAKWDSHAIELAQCFADNSGEGKPLSGRFPYALAELLRKYDTPSREDGKTKPFHIETIGEFDALAVIRKELEHVVRQQGNGAPASFMDTAGQYLKECRGRRLDDFLGPFLTVSFINRGGET